MIVVSHLPALWMLFKVPGKREIREAALSPEDENNPGARLLISNQRRPTSKCVSKAQTGRDSETLTARLSLLCGNEALVHKPVLS